MTVIECIEAIERLRAIARNTPEGNPIYSEITQTIKLLLKKISDTEIKK